MKKTFAFAITILLMFVLFTTRKAQASAVLLEEGNYAEETLGDLDKAIAIARYVFPVPAGPILNTMS